MKNILPLVLSLFLLKPLVAFQSVVDSTNCNNDEAHQFDFWIGEWDINQTIIQKDGSWIETKAHTSVSPILNGCALEEHWSGDVKFFWMGMDSVKPMKGFSIRYFDVNAKKWDIYWMDNFGLNFGNASKGIFKDGKGEFFSERKTENGKQISRITFSNIKENSVHWDLAISNDDGKNWATIWNMEMKRSSPN